MVHLKNVNLTVIYRRKLSFSDERILIIPKFGSSIYEGLKYKRYKI